MTATVGPSSSRRRAGGLVGPVRASLLAAVVGAVLAFLLSDSSAAATGRTAFGRYDAPATVRVDAPGRLLDAFETSPFATSTTTLSGARSYRYDAGASQPVDALANAPSDSSQAQMPQSGTASAGQDEPHDRESLRSAGASFAPNPARFCSFSAETEVFMADGTTKPISEIDVGEYVLAEDPETGERGPREVTHLWVHQDILIDLEIDGHDVATTEDHPFWNHTDSEWQPASALNAGDLVLTADGTTLAVDRMDWGSARTTTAYNLTVDGIHTYFVEVGRDEVLVHNTCPWELDALSASGQRVVSNDGLYRSAQKLQQHGGLGNLPVISGKVATKNALATDLLDDILTSPGTRIVTNQGGNFAGGRTFIDPLGRGAVYDADGVFQYFGTFR